MLLYCLIIFSWLITKFRSIQCNNHIDISYHILHNKHSDIKIKILLLQLLLSGATVALFLSVWRDMDGCSRDVANLCPLYAVCAAFNIDQQRYVDMGYICQYMYLVYMLLVKQCFASLEGCLQGNAFETLHCVRFLPEAIIVRNDSWARYCLSG